MADNMSHRFLDEIEEAVAAGDTLKRDIMVEAVGRTCGDIGQSAGKTDGNRIPGAFSDDDLTATIRKMLGELLVISTARAKRAYEVLGPYVT